MILLFWKKKFTEHWTLLLHKKVIGVPNQLIYASDNSHQRLGAQRMETMREFFIGYLFAKNQILQVLLCKQLIYRLEGEKEKEKKTQERNSTLHLVTVHFFKSFIAQPGASNWFRFSFLTSGFVINPATPFLLASGSGVAGPKTSLHCSTYDLQGEEAFQIGSVCQEQTKKLAIQISLLVPFSHWLSS